MFGIESIVIDILLNFFSHDTINAFLNDPRTTATIIGTLIAISGALLGTFLLLRGMALTSDAISHTVLLGIVVAFMIMTTVFNQEPDTSSPWLIIGAATAGVATRRVDRVHLSLWISQTGCRLRASLSVIIRDFDHLDFAPSGECTYRRRCGHGRRNWCGVGKHQQPLPRKLWLR